MVNVSFQLRFFSILARLDISGDSFPCADVSFALDVHSSVFGVATRKSPVMVTVKIHCTRLTKREKLCKRDRCLHVRTW